MSDELKRAILTWQDILVNDAAYKSEVESRKDEITEWFKERIEQNRDALIRAAASQQMIVEKSRKVKGVRFGGGLTRPVIGEAEENRDIVGKIHLAPSGCVYCGWSWYGAGILYLDSGRMNDKRHHVCAIDGKSKSTFFVQFCPVCPSDVAAICGCEVRDLPDLVRHHFSSEEPYSGNHLLNRIDPMEWVVRNHLWEAVRFCTVACFSKKGYNTARKAVGLNAIKGWDCYRERD